MGKLRQALRAPPGQCPLQPAAFWGPMELPPRQVPPNPPCKEPPPPQKYRQTVGAGRGLSCPFIGCEGARSGRRRLYGTVPEPLGSEGGSLRPGPGVRGAGRGAAGMVHAQRGSPCPSHAAAGAGGGVKIFTKGLGAERGGSVPKSLTPGGGPGEREPAQGISVGVGLGVPWSRPRAGSQGGAQPGPGPPPHMGKDQDGPPGALHDPKGLGPPAPPLCIA